MAVLWKTSHRDGTLAAYLNHVRNLSYLWLYVTLRCLDARIWRPASWLILWQTCAQRLVRSTGSSMPLLLSLFCNKRELSLGRVLPFEHDRWSHQAAEVVVIMTTVVPDNHVWFRLLLQTSSWDIDATLCLSVIYDRILLVKSAHRSYLIIRLCDLTDCLSNLLILARSWCLPMLIIWVEVYA